MSYIVAKGTGKSLNDDTYEVRIIHNTSGTDTGIEFALGSDGFVLKYESVDDKFLVPGIVHSRCEVTTMWQQGTHTKLDQLLSALLTSEDGDYILEVLKDGARYWVGVIMVEEFKVDEDDNLRQVQIVASDGISLLKHVDYNDDGTAYTNHQTIFDTLKNLQEKWVLYDYLNAQNSGTEYRIAWAEDVYSEDDYVMAAYTHPAGTDKKSIQRARTYSNVWHEQTTEGVQFVKAYDVLLSLCNTFQWRLYSHGDAWHFMPQSITTLRVDGNVLQWDGTIVDREVISRYQYQLDATNNVRQKDANWTLSYTPPVNSCKVKRDTGGGPYVLHAFGFDIGTAQNGAAMEYPGADTENSDVFYKLHGRIDFTGTAIANLDNPTAEIVLRFEIRFGESGTYTYYKNELFDNSGILQGFTWIDGVYDSIPAGAQNPGYSGTAGYYYYVPLVGQAVYNAGEDYFRQYNFEIMVPPPATAKTGVTVTPDFLIFDSNGTNNATYKASMSADVAMLAMEKRSGDNREALPDWDIVARASAGRGEIDLGTTYVGQLGGGQGGITVRTDASTYGTTEQWVNQASDDARQINTLLVEEILAHHNAPKYVERGSIVLRGSAAEVPKPFARFNDADTGNFYTAINYQLNATACEVDVTLRKAGRDAISITTSDENTGKGVTVQGGSTGQDQTTPVPVTRGYNVQANEIFAQNWSSIIGAGETLEAYYTVLPDGTGKKTDHQGETPASGFSINRKIYFRTLGLHESTDTGWLALPINQPAEGDTLEQAFEKIDLYMSGLQNASYSFLVTYKEESDYLLDDFAGAQGAYSLRKLRSAYTGNCIRVRRSSDNTTQDIGFNGTELDTSALSTFCGSGNGWVEILYDQSGNGRNAINTDTGEQPQIYSAGSVITDNNKPCMKFDGSNDALYTTSFAPNPNGAYNFVMVSSYARVNAPGQYSASCWGTGSGQQNFQLLMLGSAKMRCGVRYSSPTDQFPRTDSTATFTANTQIVTTATFATGECEAYHNGTQELDKHSQSLNGNPNNHSRVLGIGARSHDGAAPMQGQLQEFIVFSNSTAHDAETLSDAVNEFYGAF